MERSIQRGMCFTRYLIVRDQLTASMTRLGSGFMLPSVLSEAKNHLYEIQKLVTQLEEIAQHKDSYCSSNRLQ